MKLVLATNNEGKIREMRAIFGAAGIETVSLNELGVSSEPVETADTFLGNAVIKAEAAMKATGLPAVSDDSGLLIDALNGEPGVHSARFAEPGKRKKTVLFKMEDVPLEQRTARFVCVAACCFPDGRVVSAEGVCEGRITREYRGSGGFGYDPIFLADEVGLTFAEMDEQVKNQISHRARAIEALAHQLRQLLDLGE